jgi:dolichol kinase
MTSNQISYKSEILRKGIHLLSIVLPLTYYFLDRFTGLVVLSFYTILVIFIDIFSKPNYPLNNIIDRYLGTLIRPHEKDPRWWKLNGASWITFSALICFYFFPIDIAFTSFIVIIFGDPAAALIGRRFGRIKIFNKSLEGFLAFIIAGFFVVFILNNLGFGDSNYLFYSSICLIIAGIVESITDVIKIDDNLAVPVSFNLAYLLLDKVI